MRFKNTSPKSFILAYIHCCSKAVQLNNFTSLFWYQMLMISQYVRKSRRICSKHISIAPTRIFICSSGFCLFLSKAKKSVEQCECEVQHFLDEISMNHSSSNKRNQNHRLLCYGKNIETKYVNLVNMFVLQMDDIFSWNWQWKGDVIKGPIFTYNWSALINNFRSAHSRPIEREMRLHIFSIVLGQD